MFSLHYYTLGSRAEKGIYPTNYLGRYTIVLQFENEMSVRNFIKGLGEVHKNHINLNEVVFILGQVMDKFYELGLTGAFTPKTVLEVV